MVLRRPYSIRDSDSSTGIKRLKQFIRADGSFEDAAPPMRRNGTGQPQNAAAPSRQVAPAAQATAARWFYQSAMNDKLKFGIRRGPEDVKSNQETEFDLPPCTPERLDTESLQLFNRITEICMEIIVPIHVGVTVSIGFDGVLVANPKNVWMSNAQKTIQGMVSVSFLVWMGPVSIVFHAAGVVTISSSTSKDIGTMIYYAAKSIYPKFFTSNEQKTIAAAKRATEEKLQLLKIPYKVESEWARWAIELSDRTRMLLTSTGNRIARKLAWILDTERKFIDEVRQQIAEIRKNSTDLGVIHELNQQLTTRTNEFMEDIGVGKAATQRWVEGAWDAWNHISSHIALKIVPDPDVVSDSLLSLIKKLRTYRAWYIAYMAHLLAEEVAKGIFGNNGRYEAMDFCMTVEDAEIDLQACLSGGAECYQIMYGDKPIYRFPSFSNTLPRKVQAGGKALCSLFEGYQSTIPSDIDKTTFDWLYDYRWNLVSNKHGSRIPGAILKIIPKLFLQLAKSHSAARQEVSRSPSFQGDGAEELAKVLRLLDAEESSILRFAYNENDGWATRLKTMQDGKWVYYQAKATPVFEFAFELSRPCAGITPSTPIEKLVLCAKDCMFGPFTLRNLQFHETQIKNKLAAFNMADREMSTKLTVTLHARIGFLFNWGQWLKMWGICGLPTFEATIRPTMSYEVWVDSKENLYVSADKDDTKELALVILSFPIGGSLRLDMRHSFTTRKTMVAVAFEILPGGLTGVETLAFHVGHKLFPLILELMKEAPTKEELGMTQQPGRDLEEELDKNDPKARGFMQKLQSLDGGLLKAMLANFTVTGVEAAALLKGGYAFSKGITFQQSRVRLKLTFTRTPNPSGDIYTIAASLVTFSYEGYKMTESPIMQALQKVADNPIMPGIILVWCDQTDVDISGIHLRQKYNQKCPPPAQSNQATANAGANPMAVAGEVRVRGLRNASNAGATQAAPNARPQGPPHAMPSRAQVARPADSIGAGLVGKRVQYFSQSQRTWLPAVVQAYHPPPNDNYDLDVKRGVHASQIRLVDRG